MMGVVMIRRYLICLVSCLSGLAGETSVKAEAQKVAVSVTPGFDDDVWLGYTLEYALKITNTGSKPILLPSKKSAVTVMLQEAEPSDTSRGATPRWKTVYTARWYDTGTNFYDQCVTVEPGKVSMINDLASSVIVRRSEPPTGKRLRLTLDVLCRRAPEVPLSTATITTEPFDVPRPTP